MESTTPKKDEISAKKDEISAKKDENEANFEDNKEESNKSDSEESVVQKKTLSDEDIKHIWLNKSFPGSYTGIYTFSNSLRYYYNLHVRKTRLRRVLHQIPGFYMHILRPKRGQRRKMNLNTFGQLCQVDLAFMHNYDEFKYFVLLIDIFSQNIYARPLEDKGKESVKTALEEIFKEMGKKPTNLESDQGTEFTGNKAFFQAEGINFRIKGGQNKASFAEGAIFKVRLTSWFNSHHNYSPYDIKN